MKRKAPRRAKIIFEEHSLNQSYMEQILVELVDLERAQQLWDTPTSFSSSYDYTLPPSQKQAMHRVSCPSDWRGFAYLSGRNSFFDLPFGTPPSANRETGNFPKTEPVNPIGDQPKVPNLNNKENNNAANPNLVEVNAEDVPAANNDNMAQASVQGGQLSSITVFSAVTPLPLIW